MKSLTFYFNRQPTDDEMRQLHELVKRILDEQLAHLKAIEP